MALDRWIALIFVAMCFVYGYAAFFTMDDLLPPILQRNPIWPSTFPKILAVCGVVVGLVVLFGTKPPKVDTVAKVRGLDPLEKEKEEAPDDAVIDLKRLGDYHIWQAVALLAAMVVYAVMLRPLGFLLATVAFLVAGGALLGERKFHIMILVAVIATGVIWYLVQEVLGIFLSPLPRFM